MARTTTDRGTVVRRLCTQSVLAPCPHRDEKGTHSLPRVVAHRGRSPVASSVRSALMSLTSTVLAYPRGSIESVQTVRLLKTPELLSSVGI
jgi:hypothetical protein